MHGVTPGEFEQVVNNEPLALDYELIDGEDRYRAVGLTVAGRLLTVVFTIRSGKVIAIPESGSVAHVKENAVALSMALTPEELHTLDATFPRPAGEK